MFDAPAMDQESPEDAEADPEAQDPSDVNNSNNNASKNKKKQSRKGGNNPNPNAKSQEQHQAEVDSMNATMNTDADDCDDEDHYYKIRIGEVLNREYRVVQKLGKGVFANVCKAVQISNGREVAIKILRTEDIMLRAGEKEKQILELLNSTDKYDKRHIVRMLASFEHRRHLCLVFELMDMNLREALRIYGKGKGLSLDAVRSYAMQLFVGLMHLRKNKIIHADIKPDNILLSADTKTVKICDLGTAFPVEESSLVEYMASRFYRAPEIIIGYTYDMSIDVWSTACTLYELYTGQFLFNGRNNNDMLKHIL